jgi:hypothetical protein
MSDFSGNWPMSNFPETIIETKTKKKCQNKKQKQKNISEA